MKSSEDILKDIKNIFSIDWKVRDGIKVPESDAVTLGNDAVRLDGTVLYADLADSTNLVNSYRDWFAAEVYKAYLEATCHIIRNNSGEITAFDGDRVMAVFLGQAKNSSATKAALQIKYLVNQINLTLKSKYPATTYQLQQSVGIDTSSLFVAKTGIRNSNDLVWVGRAANYAAKLSSMGDGAYTTFITEAVYNVLSEETKYGGNPKRNMWEKIIWSERSIAIYKTNWRWEF